MPQGISDARKSVLRAIARGCDLQKLKDEIVLRERNKALFRRAIDQEDMTIAEYRFMIEVKEETGAGP